MRLKTGLGSVASVILGCLPLDSESKNAIYGADGPKIAATNLVTVLIFALFCPRPSNWGIKQGVKLLERGHFGSFQLAKPKMGRPEIESLLQLYT